METPFHPLAELFRQLGLADEPAAIERFVASHRPLPAGVSLCDAPFWTVSQAQFLRQAIHHDADWAEPVDSLAVMLSA
jgi:hypothetical protein